ncbi:hypothetical protein [Marinomonas fungiae]|uniref:Uncharacterized protein n=1 Tax=Marinomonas fungiae TaxID=1137284 RepID=A0A0K6IQ04_9GAMM|nr:hypothetical protein [Marinomonas fungiae]CUB05402.1 hypothetical protein Ga0061065_11097 [Marinomonas fungiae]
MSKKSMYWQLACLLPFATSTSLCAENLSGTAYSASLEEQFFPSKTYFLMAVDNEITRNIRDQDVGDLIGVPNIDTNHAEAIYYGMRKAMLKYAARAWDAGVAASYGKNVGRMIGWQKPDESRDPNDVRIVNKLLLFRYAQQFGESNELLQHYYQELSQKAVQMEENTVAGCKQQENYSDYIFYKELGQLSTDLNQLYPIAANYELLISCNKQQVESMLSAKSHTITKHDIASIIQVASNF